MGDQVDSKDSATREYVDKCFQPLQTTFQNNGSRDIEALRKELTVLRKNYMSLNKFIGIIERKLKQQIESGRQYSD